MQTPGSTLSTHPHQHDCDELLTIYSHLDSTTAIGAATMLPNGMTLSDFSDRANWGKLLDSIVFPRGPDSGLALFV